MFLGKFFMGGDRVDAYANYDGITVGKMRQVIFKGAGLGGAAWCIVLGIKI